MVRAADIFSNELKKVRTVKRFNCADVIPGCDHSYSGETEEELLATIAAHAVSDHGFDDFTDDHRCMVRGVIKEEV